MDKVVLKNPVIWGSETISELTFRELKGKDLRGIKLNALEFGDLLDLAAKLSGHPPSVLDQLTMGDATRAIEIVGKQLNSGM